MKNWKIISTGIAMLICFVTYSQQGTFEKPNANLKLITGVVLDETGPLPGANITVVGTSRGTQTDIDGNYSIQGAEGEKLRFAYVGYADKEITIAKLNVINVTLVGGVELESVVITDLGIRKSDKITSTYDVVNSETYAQNDKKSRKKSEQLNQAASPVAVKSLQGKVSGLQITNANQNQTTGTFRGNRSNINNNQALIVIDGKIATLNEFEKISPEKIKDVTTLKGAQGAALYGSDGVNGVIVIKTLNYIQPQVAENTEEYDSFVENQFKSPQAAPLSTFSIDVDNASYTNIRRLINNGQKVPKDAVRVEEMVNFFKYQYPQPIDQNPFSINTEYSGCPWNPNHKLLRIGLQGKDIPMAKLPASNMVFLIDVSGSMSSENKLPLLIQSMKILVNELRKEDKVSIVVYAGAAGMVLPPTSGDQKSTIIAAFEKLSAGGSTAGGAGIELAYKLASENFIDGGNNRVILATDGDFNVGSSSDKDMESLIVEKRESGVFLTCLGYGMGNYKDSKLEIIANKGNGNYAYIDNMQEANRFLAKEFKGSMFAIAKDVKIQIEFNPAYVQSYRLIGYENRKLRAEDFNNDVIDAGELGSGHTVTALYEVIPAGITSSFAPSVDKLKYATTNPSTAKQNGQLAFIKFRYKKPDGKKSILMTSEIAENASQLANASSDFKFCASVAWFGLQLRDSKLISDKSSDAVRLLARNGIAADTDGYRSEFIRLVETNIPN